MPQLLLVLERQRRLQHVAAEGPEGLDELVGGHAVDHHEHRRAVVGGQKIAHAVLEIAIDAVLHDEAREGADTGPERRADEGHEEQKAEQHAPEQAPHRARPHLRTGRDHVVLPSRAPRHHGDGLQADDEVLTEVEDLLVRGLGFRFARITEHNERTHGQSSFRLAA